MKDCCDKGDELAALKRSHASVLWIVLTINLAMFAVEFSYGYIARSSSLLADSLDMLGDAFVYAFSLFVLDRSSRWQAGASLSKGIIMLLFGIGVLAEALFKAWSTSVPNYETMSWVGLLALSMNAICFLLLWKHRSDNLNMSSTWSCSRNDLIANSGVLLAALATFCTHSKWPDLVVGIAIASLFVRSAFGVIKRSHEALIEKPCQESHGEGACCPDPDSSVSVRIEVNQSKN